MSLHFATRLEEASLGEHEGTGADGRYPRAPRRRPTQGRDRAGIRMLAGPGTGDHDRVGGLGTVEPVRHEHVEPSGAGDPARLGRAGEHVVSRVTGHRYSAEDQVRDSQLEGADRRLSDDGDLMYGQILRAYGIRATVPSI